MKVYLDTSLVLAYLLEGDRRLEAVPGHRVVASSRLLWVEVSRALERAVRQEQLSADDGVVARRAFVQLAKGITRLRLDERVLRRGESSYPLVVRTLDALHLATALVWSADDSPEDTEVWSLDRPMNLCAAALGFATPLLSMGSKSEPRPRGGEKPHA